MKLVVAISVLAVLLQAQAPAPGSEQEELNRTLADAGNSSVDLIRGLEQFLKKYPDTKQRAEIEKALAKSAIDSNDGARIVLYGERVLGRAPVDPQLEPVLLDRVVRELSGKTDAESTKKALEYVKRYEALIATMRKQTPPQHFTPGEWSEQLDLVEARALALEAQATGNAGNIEDAVAIAKRSWTAYPTAEGAREAAGWLVKAGRDAEALEYYSDSFAVQDSRSTQADRDRDRARMGALFAKLHGSEQGLGDVILQAYDRTSALMKERMANLKLKDPNAEAGTVYDFTLPSMNGGDSLPLASLKGKTLVMDFWATWCVPCRAQHPLIESVKKRFADRPDVVFLAVDTDDDPTLVAPFLKSQGWAGPVYFEEGLERKLIIASIPTVLVLSPAGRVSSRMSGFAPDRFEDLLSERIEEARGVAH